MILEFNTDQIADLAAKTVGQQDQWDSIWTDVKSAIGRTISTALDSYTGGSLEERSTNYHHKTQLYTEQLQSQAIATARVGSIAAETNVAMAKTVSVR